MLKVKCVISETLASPNGVTKLRGFPEHSLKQINSHYCGQQCPPTFSAAFVLEESPPPPHLDLEKSFKSYETTNYVVLCNITNFEAKKIINQVFN